MNGDYQSATTPVTNHPCADNSNLKNGEEEWVELTGYAWLAQGYSRALVRDALYEALTLILPKEDQQTEYNTTTTTTTTTMMKTTTDDTTIRRDKGEQLWALAAGQVSAWQRWGHAQDDVEAILRAQMAYKQRSVDLVFQAQLHQLQQRPTMVVETTTNT